MAKSKKTTTKKNVDEPKTHRLTVVLSQDSKLKVHAEAIKRNDRPNAIVEELIQRNL